MRKFAVIIALMLMTIAVFPVSAFANDKVITMSTTTSTQASGLLDVLLPALEKDTGITIKVIAKGTGAAIRDGMEGNVDVIFVHAKEREEQFVAEGYGTKRYPVMHNDFVILGPAADPAGVMGMKDTVAALEKIAATGAGFVSRGDDSGTHTMEQSLWKATDLTLIQDKSSMVKSGKLSEINFVRPAGDWYMSIGQGMGETLTMAEEKQVYTMSDRGTFIKYKFGRDQGLGLDIAVEGDPLLFNPYGIIPVNPEKFPHVKFVVVQEFVNWLIGEPGQKLIKNYTLHGKQLFMPDAIPGI